MNERTPLRRRVAKTVIRHQYDAIASETGLFGGGGEEGEEERKKQSGPAACLGLPISDALAMILVLSSMTTAFFTDILFVNLACAVNLVLGAYCLYQNRVLSKLPSIRELHNRLREQTNSLRGENARLNRSVYRLDMSVTRMEAVEEELAAIAGDASGGVRRLIAATDEQRMINREMEEKLKAEVLQTVIGAVVRSDRNRDFLLSPTEMESLVVRLGLIKGVGFDEKKFRQELRDNSSPLDFAAVHYSLDAIMSVLRNLIRGHSGDIFGEDGNIFSLHSENLTDAVADE
uniref:Uncharacterized protein n=1 Tax=Odontella aurita TaxID=265563 RepID=A0A7S4MV79_9STRA|mmetsp:Transcript_34786/g.103768  ORF Transcript_34786/g.103768 Transcript_34786/m.103768 type:complete len:289 (+) Transcript_34786:180-1046(+)